uniref:Uncharacterized protein n=1 Tax=viral metagenome TaxID=1070528 RepID=A0A6C0J263_9ZZZZ
MDEQLLISQEISIYGCYTSVCILVGSIVAGVYNFHVSAILGFLLSITSYMHWKQVMIFSWIKIIDSLLASTLILNITFVDSSRFHPTYRLIWIAAVGTVVVVFVMNEILLYYQVKNPIYVGEISSSHYRYFSTYYTEPGTTQREYAEYRSTFTHIISIHIMLVGVCIYCTYNSYYSQLLPIEENLKISGSC